MFLIDLRRMKPVPKMGDLQIASWHVALSENGIPKFQKRQSRGRHQPPKPSRGRPEASRLDRSKSPVIRSFGHATCRTRGDIGPPLGGWLAVGDCSHSWWITHGRWVIWVWLKSGYPTPEFYHVLSKGWHRSPEMARHLMVADEEKITSWAVVKWLRLGNVGGDGWTMLNIISSSFPPWRLLFWGQTAVLYHMFGHVQQRKCWQKDAAVSQECGTYHETGRSSIQWDPRRIFHAGNSPNDVP